jgi:hypothetical protein
MGFVLCFAVSILYSRVEGSRSTRLHCESLSHREYPTTPLASGHDHRPASLLRYFLLLSLDEPPFIHSRPPILSLQLIPPCSTLPLSPLRPRITGTRAFHRSTALWTIGRSERSQDPRRARSERTSPGRESSRARGWERRTGATLGVDDEWRGSWVGRVGREGEGQDGGWG